MAGRDMDVSTAMESASPATIRGVVLVKAELLIRLLAYIFSLSRLLSLLCSGVLRSLHSLYSSPSKSFFSVHCSYSVTAL